MLNCLKFDKSISRYLLVIIRRYTRMSLLQPITLTAHIEITSIDDIAVINNSWIPTILILLLLFILLYIML